MFLHTSLQGCFRGSWIVQHFSPESLPYSARHDFGWALSKRRCRWFLFATAGRRTRRCRREESEAELQSQESLLRSCLKRCAIESSSSYEAVLRRLKKAMETNAPRPLNRNEMVIRLEQALRLDMECRQGQVRVRKLRSFEDLGIL
ncbi:unnamed protein product [Durusdinium trenchii]|uniref:Uncharacterized protein n=1 Tax=Durusdinium trenchii TaxID=1381693 RepID=A0ABP0MNG7_9DINO